MDNSRKKIFFVSDFHFGVPDHASSLHRERHLVRWFNSTRHEAAAYYLMGDVFDFWFEYKTVVPKGFVRLLGTIASITDEGIPVHIFRGNHDIWAFDYLTNEVGVVLHRRPQIVNFSGKTFFLAHGDGLGPGDMGYKFLKRVFENRINQWLFRWLHPDLGTRLGLHFSKRSRIANIAREKKDEEAMVVEKEMLYAYCLKKSTLQPEIDYFVFGHRHTPIKYPLPGKAVMVILGDWVSHFTYAVFDGETVELLSFEE
ncbi:MAG TPA: UDP-2,3-diacylglucosamine diphosphatase [Bacteroidales bacterium]|nr:UDP-2,3-diacylglucosamine diphosphatase [Bacteroidales bacterium]